MTKTHHGLRLKQLGIDTYKEAVIYIHQDCHVCRSEGFELHTRVAVKLGKHSIIATLNIVDSNLLTLNEAGLSKYAWQLLDAKEGDELYLSHPQPPHSLAFIRAKLYGHELTAESLNSIIKDIASGQLSDIQIASFIAGCASGRLNQVEILELTKAMITAGQHLHWPTEYVVDKHCVGGLPGNRTSLIIVPIVAAYGLVIPKTSSRAITSPAGTADTMEVFAPVGLNIAAMRKVVEKENGCIIWGGAVALSPIDDILIRVEHALDIDAEGQLVASILSKKIAAGSNHVIIDIPVGTTAKVRSMQSADLLKGLLENIGKELGITICAIFTDGSQPVGRGIGPCLEAFDIQAVLQCKPDAPLDLREHALTLAGQVLEFSPTVTPGTGKQIAREILDSGRAWQKFQAICEAQGGMSKPKRAEHTHAITAKKAGKVTAIDNRRLAQIAKLAGAPNAKVAGIEFLTPLGTHVEKHQPLFIIHSATRAELEYALSVIREKNDILHLEEK